MSIVSGFSARNIPFYGLPSSKVVSDAPTAYDAMVLAGLNWNVELQPAYQQVVSIDSEFPHESVTQYREVPDRFLTVRSDTQTVLGNVGKVYRPFQNESAFSFADALPELAGIQFDAAGSYNNDRDIFLTAKIPDGLTVPGTDDAIDLYLLFTNNHAGMGSIQGMVTPIRLACTNMLNLALRNAVSSWKVRHTSTAPEKVEEAIRALGILDAYRAEFEATAALLLETEVNLEGFTTLVDALTDAPRLRTGMLQTWSNSPTVDRRTGWGAINAIGEFMEHERNGKGSLDSRFDSNIDGQTAATRNRALQLLTRR
jgi:phage/plasmid-like protein (TIGR03299 family)